MRRISLFLSIVLGCFLTLGLFSQPVFAEEEVPEALSFSLEEAIEYGLENSPELEKLKIEEKIQEQAKNMAQAQARDTKKQRKKAGLGTSWELTQLEVIAPEAQIMGYNIKLHNLQYNKEKIKLDIEQMYYNVLLFEKQLEIAEKTLKNVEEQLRQTNVKFAVGTAAKWEVVKAESDYSMQQAQFEEKKTQYETFVMNFNKLLGLPLETKISLTSEFSFEEETNIDLEEVIKKTLQSDPSLFASREQLKLAELTFEEVGKIYTPNVYTYRELKQEKEKAQLDLKEAQKNLVKSIQDEYLKLESAKEQYSALKNSVETAKEAYRIMKIRYDVGMATQLEVMQSAENLDQAEIGLVNALFNYNQIKAKFENAIFPNPLMAGGMGA